MNLVKSTLLSLVLIILGALPTLGAVGCDLNDPDRDVARLFPESTGYRTSYASIEKQGGEALLKKVEARLGDTFHGIYETMDVPYTIYTIFSGEKKIGYIHGVNQKGQYGGIQVFVALDLKGGIKAYYIQKLTSQWARKLRELEFGRQFVGLSLKDFEAFDVVAGEGPGRLAQVHSPVPEALIDFRAAMRALKKNLILMDVFVFSTQQEKSS